MAKKAELTVPKEKYDRALAALRGLLSVISDMDKSGALRLPFPSLPEAVKFARDVVKK